ncbi:Tetratricopeptide repeat-containing protein [Lampropedia hyalina DSM 16112]|jgi:hypothetical protein|uniref:Tetratricopeptide repeat-containing protein n=2 Tax=Lampropedia TaxID=198705 RepID=A0A1M4UFU6_9BURK|nr:Tetratricopeptide repeat-containing protein [Lampropedia hyalina DSM 16112]
MKFVFQYSGKCWQLAVWLLAASWPVWAQQDTADRLWQGVEQRSRQQVAPEPLGEDAQTSLYDPALAALLQTPHQRIQQLTLAILNAVNQRDWFGADRLLRQYVQVPQHDPSLEMFVMSSRMAAGGDYEGAIAGYQAVLQANPQFVRGELDMARVLYADHRLRDAQEVFDRLHSQPLPPSVIQHIDEYLKALKQRRQPRFSLSVSAVREDNVNGASTVVDPCALVFLGVCLPNTPGQKRAASGVYVEATLNKLWPLAGNHGLMLRSINYGNHYRHESDFDNLVSTNYLGYQYASARQQWQVLPLFEYDREGGRKIYHAFGVRASFTRQLNERAQVEASYEFKARHFSPQFSENLQGHLQSFSLFGTYAFKPDLAAYGSLSWRESDARLPIFAYREKVARLGIYKAFGNQVTVNAAYGYRQKQAEADNAVFGRRQRDHEGSIYLNLALPGYQWQGFTPTASYEYRDNRSSIPHAYSHQKNRLTLGVRKDF